MIIGNVLFEWLLCFFSSPNQYVCIMQMRRNKRQTRDIKWPIVWSSLWCAEKRNRRRNYCEAAAALLTPRTRKGLCQALVHSEFLKIKFFSWLMNSFFLHQAHLSREINMQIRIIIYPEIGVVGCVIGIH